MRAPGDTTTNRTSADEHAKADLRRLGSYVARLFVRPLWRAFKFLGWLLSGEWMLACHSNGGAVILARSMFVAFWVFATSSALHCAASSNKCHLHILSIHLSDQSVPWFGAIFAGLYASLYARFASQWSYLADLYNRIKQTESETQLTSRDERRERIAEWKAAFLEDADELHLAAKPIFAAIICVWVQDARVRDAYVTHAPRGGRGLRSLQMRAAAAAERSTRLF